MRKLCLLSLTIVVLTVSLVLPQFRTRAQAPMLLKAGQLTTAEFTDSAPQIKFLFSGKQNEQYYVTFSSIGKDSVDGELTIMDSKGQTLGNGDFVAKRAFVQLPANGDYTVIAARTFDKNGPFAIQLLPVKKLSRGQKAEATITTQVLMDDGEFVGTNAFFSVQSTSDFKLTITPGESKSPQGLTGQTSSTISLSDSATVYEGGGDQFIAVSVTLHGSTESYLLSIGYNGYSASKAITKGDILTSKFTVTVDALQS